METLTIKTTSKQYPVTIGVNAIDTLPQLIMNQYAKVHNILIITDEKVATLHLNTVAKTLEITGIEVLTHIVPEGEFAKTFDVYYECQSFCLSHKLNRKSLIIALGGGAVGDLVGFVAATFMRGVPFIQVPTTLLAHDSAVGGKVAINHPLGKNMIGAFYQPEAVIYDLNFLKTLPLQELRSGFAEVIKHALISDSAFYEYLHMDIQDLGQLSDEQLFKIIKRGIQVKAAIVEEDEKEHGVRAYLNFGHTLGHAIEASLGYGKFTHGEAILIGMVFALKLSKDKIGLDFDLANFLRWTKQLGYRTEIQKELEMNRLIELMKGDKKAVTSQATFVLLEQIGSPTLMELTDEELRSELKHSIEC